MEDTKLDKVLIKIEDIGNKVDNLGGKVDNLVVRMEKTEKQVDNIAVAVVDIQEQLKNCVTKDYLEEQVNSILISTDRFVKLHETLDQELVMMRNKYNRLEERVQALEQRAFAAA